MTKPKLLTTLVDQLGIEDPKALFAFAANADHCVAVQELSCPRVVEAPLKEKETI